MTERGIGKSRTSRPPASSDAAATPDAHGAHGANDANDVGSAADDSPPASARESRAPRRATLAQGFVRSTTRVGIPAPARPVAGAPPESTRGVSAPPPSTRGVSMPPESTRGVSAAPPESTRGVSAPPPSTRGVSAPPPLSQGRYSQQPGAEEDVAEARSMTPSASRTQRTMPSRQPLRLDARQVTPSAPPESPLAVTPRVVGSARSAGASLTSSEAFVLGLIDGKTTVRDLVDAAGLSEREVMSILANLMRLGIVTTASADRPSAPR